MSEPKPGPMPYGAGAPAMNPYASPGAAYTPAVTGGHIGHQVVPLDPIFSYAWQVWQANLGLLVGVTVIVIAISYAVAIPFMIGEFALRENDAPEAAAFVSLAGQLIGQVVQIFLGVGQVLIALKLARSQPATFSDLFSGGPRFLPVLGGSILGGIMFTIGFMACIVPGIILALMFWPYYYLIVDNKRGVFESFQTAQTITQGNWGTAFILAIASFGIMILGLLALCVGVIFAAPLVTMLWATAYLMMSGQLQPGAVARKW